MSGAKVNPSCYPLRPLRPRATPFPEEISILGVIYGVLMWADMNAATPLWGVGTLCVSLGGAERWPSVVRVLRTALPAHARTPRRQVRKCVPQRDVATDTKLQLDAPEFPRASGEPATTHARQEIILKCAKIALIQQKPSGLETTCTNICITSQIK